MQTYNLGETWAGCGGANRQDRKKSNFWVFPAASNGTHKKTHKMMCHCRMVHCFLVFGTHEWPLLGMHISGTQTNQFVTSCRRAGLNNDVWRSKKGKSDLSAQVLGQAMLVSLNLGQKEFSVAILPGQSKLLWVKTQKQHFSQVWRQASLKFGIEQI